MMRCDPEVSASYSCLSEGVDGSGVCSGAHRNEEKIILWLAFDSGGHLDELATKTRDICEFANHAETCRRPLAKISLIWLGYSWHRIAYARSFPL